MPRASESPFPPDIVRCSKSWTTVDAGRCSPCSPMNGHQEEDALLFRERLPGRRRRREEGSQSRNSRDGDTKRRPEHVWLLLYDISLPLATLGRQHLNMSKSQ